jgi:hypothetical protein
VVDHPPRRDPLCLTDEWTCRLYEQPFVDQGVLVAPLVATIEATECAACRYPPLRYRHRSHLHRWQNASLVSIDHR